MWYFGGTTAMLNVAECTFSNIITRLVNMPVIHS